MMKLTVGTPEGKNHVTGLGVGGGWIFKMVLKQMLCDEVDWIQVSQNSAPVGAVPKRRGIS
jgi:hypothetical protein